ncbi:hypothetical protein RRG08_054825 [Elysia crispata]|uniref:Uncharacterized protein n=1 Tax=Elysia crispata TaxID=231223 RepID=A0AAE1B9K4_9GAST|nr:hypothetical protein RRG08_054825 [Elysia crispata]
MGFTPIPLVAVAVLGLGNLLHIIGLSTPEWVTADVSSPFLGRFETTRGLFKACVDDDCVTIDDKPDWLKASQAMAILGMLVGLGAAALACIMFVMGLMNKDSFKSLGVLSFLAAVVSFIMILICVIVYAVEIKEDESGWYFGYSFGLSIAGAILVVLGGCIAFGASRVPNFCKPFDISLVTDVNKLLQSNMASKPTRLTVLGVLGVGNLLHIIGLSTPKWVTADLSIPYLWQVQTTRGLFELCTNDNCVTIAVKPDHLDVIARTNSENQLSHDVWKDSKSWLPVHGFLGLVVAQFGTGPCRRKGS